MIIDKSLVVSKAIERIANDYDLTTDTVKKAIDKSRFPLDFDRMIEEGSFCFRGPDEESRADNASICMASKILANKGVQEHILPILCNRIKAWDHKNIEDLLDIIKKIISIMELNPDDHTLMETCVLDVNKLPSEVIPKDIIPDYRIWAMDKKGMCLVGDDANKIVHIDNISRKK